MEQRKEVLLQLTKEESEIISDFINFNNWDLDAILLRNDWETETEHNFQESVVDETTRNTCSAESAVSNPTEEPLGDDRGINNGGGGGGDHDPPNDGLNPGECNFCFCCPCVTSNRQAWLGSGARPHNRNSAIRKVKYRKFWNLLSGAGAWFHPRYVHKKSQILGRHNTDDLGEMWTLREIMPDCVLNLVRELYPNPPGRPYMGHRWT